MKLENEPLFEALFEFRFSPKMPFSDIAPGILFNSLKAEGIQRLPHSELPKSIRENDPNLQFLPLIRLELENFFVSIGDRVVTVACKLPYMGWDTGFKQKILEVIDSIARLEAIDNVVRHSIKYSNLIEGSTQAEQFRKLEIAMRLGDKNVSEQNFQLKCDWSDQEFVHLITAASSANIKLIDGSERNGILLDVDTIENFAPKPFIEWKLAISEQIQKARLSNKTVFFSCLTQDAINEFGPTYS